MSEALTLEPIMKTDPNPMNASSFENASSCDSDYSQVARFTLSALRMADPPTLLVVDDDAIFRELETRALCNQGYKVLQADGAAEALRLAGATPTIDLLVTDFVMPDVNGLELARQFRAMRPGTPVLMVSGTLSLIKDKTAELDRFAVLEKSASFVQLFEKIHALLADVVPVPLLNTEANSQPKTTSVT